MKKWYKKGIVALVSRWRNSVEVDGEMQKNINMFKELHNKFVAKKILGNLRIWQIREL